MRTTLDIDEDILRAAMALSKGRTKSDIVNEALRRFAGAKSRRQLLELRGKVAWKGSVDRVRTR